MQKANIISSETIQSKNEDHFLDLISLEEVIFNLNSENIEESANSIRFLFYKNNPNPFFNFICQMVYTSFVAQMEDCNIYFDFLKEIEKEYGNEESHIMNIFWDVLTSIGSQESNYLLGKMFEQNLVNVRIIINKENSIYFAQYLSMEEIFRYPKDQFSQNFFQDYEELSKNDWELHKQLANDGHNPNGIAKIIRNDEIEKLQEISSQLHFNFNRFIAPSLYERCSFVNQMNVLLIDYAAFFGSVNCFKYLLMNGSKIEDTGKYAVAGGNLEIIHLCEQNHSSFKNAYETAIEFHRNDIFKYIYENKLEFDVNINALMKKCFLCNSYEILYYLLPKENIKITESYIIELMQTCDLFILGSLLKDYQFTNDIFVLCAGSKNIEFVEYVFNYVKRYINVRNIHLFYIMYIFVI